MEFPFSQLWPCSQWVFLWQVNWMECFIHSSRCIECKRQPATNTLTLWGLRQQMTVSTLWSLVSRKLGIKGLAICINFTIFFRENLYFKLLGILEYLHRSLIIIEQANSIIQPTSVDPYLKRYNKDRYIFSENPEKWEKVVTGNFSQELEYWGLDSNQVEPCCWMTYTQVF